MVQVLSCFLWHFAGVHLIVDWVDNCSDDFSPGLSFRRLGFHSFKLRQELYLISHLDLLIRPLRRSLWILRGWPPIDHESIIISTFLVDVLVSALLKVVSLSLSHLICELVLKVIYGFFPFRRRHVIVLHYKLVFTSLFHFHFFSCLIFRWDLVYIQKLTLICNSFESGWLLLLPTAGWFWIHCWISQLNCGRPCISRWIWWRGAIHWSNFWDVKRWLLFSIWCFSTHRYSFWTLFLPRNRMNLSSSTDIKQSVFSDSS